MKNVEHIYEVIQRYFSDSAIVVLTVIALLFLLKKAERKYKMYVLVIGVGALFLFNDFTYGIVIRMGEAETFYRFLWMVPVTLLSAYLLVELWGVLKGKVQKVAYIIILVLLFFVNGNSSLNQWIQLPENVYQISDEQIEAAKIIRANQRHWRAKFWDDGTLANGIREYDGTIMLALDTTRYMDEILSNKIVNETGSNIQKMLIEYQIDSIGVKKENLLAQQLFENAGSRKMGETESSYLYRFEWRSIERRQSALEEYYNDAIMGINEEHVTVAGLETSYEFLYLTDMHIDLGNVGYVNANGIAATEQFAEWINMANEYDVDAVLLGANMLEYNSEENRTFVKSQLERLEMPYLWVEGKENLTLELDGVKVYAVDNREYEIDLENFNEAAVVLTYLPVESVKDDTNTELILSGSLGRFEKNLLSDEVLQYVGMPTYTGIATLITVKGE